jgi:transmembrane sensor
MVMEKYKDFQAIDFVEDEYFLKWVKNAGEDKSIDQSWNDWLLINPNKREVVEEAKKLVLAVADEKQYIIPEQQQRLLWERIDQSIEDIGDTEPVAKTKARSVWLSWYSIAATITLVAIAFVYLFQMQYWRSNNDENAFISLKQDLVQFRNDGKNANILVLHDGSKVTLQPNSILYYPEFFNSEQREVHLS